MPGYYYTYSTSVSIPGLSTSITPLNYAVTPAFDNRATTRVIPITHADLFATFDVTNGQGSVPVTIGMQLSDDGQSWTTIGHGIVLDSFFVDDDVVARCFIGDVKLFPYFIRFFVRNEAADKTIYCSLICYGRTYTLKSE